MKTLLIIVSVLAVTTMVYGFNEERIRHFNQYLMKCAEDAGAKPGEVGPEVVRCALVKDKKTLNSNGEFIKEEALKGMDDGISDASKSAQAKSIFTKCYDDEVKTGSSGQEQTIKIIECSMPAVALLDKIN